MVLTLFQEGLGLRPQEQRALCGNSDSVLSIFARLLNSSWSRKLKPSKYYSIDIINSLTERGVASLGLQPREQGALCGKMKWAKTLYVCFSNVNK